MNRENSLYAMKRTLLMLGDGFVRAVFMILFFQLFLHLQWIEYAPPTVEVVKDAAPVKEEPQKEVITRDVYTGYWRYTSSDNSCSEERTQLQCVVVFYDAVLHKTYCLEYERWDEQLSLPLCMNRSWLFYVYEVWDAKYVEYSKTLPCHMPVCQTERHRVKKRRPVHANKLL